MTARDGATGGAVARAVGIDIGTSGLRAAALDAGGAVLGLAEAGFGGAPRSPRAWAEALDAALAGLAAAVPLGAVAAVCTDGTSGTVLAIDGLGAPVGAPLMYDDAIEDPTIVAAILTHAPATSAARGGSSALARALVLQERPAAARILHQADWIAGRLSGRFDVSDESNALKTGYDPVARRWPDWLAATGLRTGVLPTVAPVGTATGRVTAAAARRHGLPEGAAVVAGLTDGCAAFLASGADRPGDGVTVLGTTLTVKLLSDRPVFSPPDGIYSHRIGGLWLAGGASNTGGGVLAALFAPGDLEALSARIDPSVPSPLDYYPLRRPGERFPVNDPALAPRLAPRPDDDAAFLHGLLEGMARIEAQGYARLAALGAPPLARIFTVGGGARNPAWGAIRVRHLGVPSLAAASDAAAVGAARIALAAVRPTARPGGAAR